MSIEISSENQFVAQLQQVALTGYCNPLSITGGKTIHFMISSRTGTPIHTQLVRVRCGDPNPHGPGFREEELASDIEPVLPSLFQPTKLGSYGVVEMSRPLPWQHGFQLGVLVWPTVLNRTRQALLTQWDPGRNVGFRLLLMADQGFALEVGDGGGTVQRVACDLRPLPCRWYRVEAGYDPGTGSFWVSQAPLNPTYGEAAVTRRQRACQLEGAELSSRPLLIGASEGQTPDGGEMVGDHFNGKLEAPEIFCSKDIGSTPELYARWDFAKETGSDRFFDLGPSGLEGRFINLPARAMCGAHWSGSSQCWREAAEDYAAVHFHEDDIYDCGWTPSVSWRVPPELPSGPYALRLRSDGHEDHLVFFVRPRTGRPRAKLAVLFPTFTYLAYCNFRSPTFDERLGQRIEAWDAFPWTALPDAGFGRSTYDHHSDGSGVCFSSRLRPNLNLRPRALALMDPRGSGVRHFTADTYITAWLDHLGEEYDVITDEDLQEEGVALLAPYRCVLTGSHPEYQTPETMDGMQSYLDGGGRLLYLGGNGFYWKIAVSPDLPGVIEVRRAEGGIRMWAAEPGEYYHALDGTYGGLWRRNRRPPNLLCGVGFSAQGTYEGSYYRQQPARRDPRVAFLFEGIDEAELIGDFGFWGGGAAGFELDRADITLGTPPHALVVASSERHGLQFAPVTEEFLQQTSLRSREEVVRADIVFFETPEGGAVLSVGSITFCGSLPYNGYDNNVARLAGNALRRFLEDEIFC